MFNLHCYVDPALGSNRMFAPIKDMPSILILILDMIIVMQPCHKRNKFNVKLTYVYSLCLHNHTEGGLSGESNHTTRMLVDISKI